MTINRAIEINKSIEDALSKYDLRGIDQDTIDLVIANLRLKLAIAQRTIKWHEIDYY